MARIAERYEKVEIRSRKELRAWLEANHEREVGVWLVRFKKHCSDLHVPHGEVVDELLCFGWVDSLVRKLDDDRSMTLITQRKPGSTWSKVNKRKAEKLRTRRLLHPAGQAAIARAEEDGSWTFLDDVEALIVPDDLEAAFTRKARRAWDGFPDSSKKGILGWIKLAKTPKTRASRIAKTAEMAAAGLRAQYPEDERAWKARQRG